MIQKVPYQNGCSVNASDSYVGGP